MAETETKKEIKISRKKEVEDLLRKAEAPQPEKPPAKGRRPSKPKPDATLRKYRDNPMAVEVNKIITISLNKTVLRNCEQMEPTDTNIGEAMLYCCEYYQWRIEHPLVILAFAMGGTAWTAIQKHGRKIILEKPPKSPKLNPEE